MPIRPIDPAARRAMRLPPRNVVTSALPEPAPVSPPQDGTPSSRPKDPTPGEPPKQPKRIQCRTKWPNGDYPVGKNRPPKDHQWVKGQSGNPRGPKKRVAVDPQEAFDQEVLADFTATINGTEVTLNNGKFAIQSLKANAAKGNVRAQTVLLNLYTNTLARVLSAKTVPDLEPWEQQIVDELIAGVDLPAVPVRRERIRPVDEDGTER